MEAETFGDYWKWIRQIKDNCGESETLIFRGQPEEKLPLLPPVMRKDVCQIPDYERIVYHEIMLEYPQEFQTRTHLSNLVRMQHYGTPTRLLDFSRNPLVALFFACEENEKDGEVVICRVKNNEILHHNSDRALMLACLPCFSDKDQKEILEVAQKHHGRIGNNSFLKYGAFYRFLHEVRGEYPAFESAVIGEDLCKNYVIAPFKDNERVRFQDGLFVIFGLNKNKLDNDPCFSIDRIKIKNSAKKMLLEDLRLMGISNATLYSGLEWRAKEIKKQLQDKIEREKV